MLTDVAAYPRLLFNLVDDDLSILLLSVFIKFPVANTGTRLKFYNYPEDCFKKRENVNVFMSESCFSLLPTSALMQFMSQYPLIWKNFDHLQFYQNYADYNVCRTVICERNKRSVSERPGSFQGRKVIRTGRQKTCSAMLLLMIHLLRDRAVYRNAVRSDFFAVREYSEPDRHLRRFPAVMAGV